MSIFHLPDLGEGLAEAEIHEWHVKEGDVVKVDQPLVTMETAKAVVEVPSPQAGRIVKLHGNKGDIIQTHAALVEFEGGDTAKKDSGTVVGSLEESTTVLNEGDMIIGAARTTTANVKAMPAVRALAKQLNVDLSQVTSSGPQGQITAEDVKKFASTGASVSSHKSKMQGHVETLHGVRRAMALAMTQSHQEIVPVTIIDDADITDLKSSDITASLIHAMVAGIKTEPALNAWYDGKTMERCLIPEINLGLAMDTEEGLFVPVLKNVANVSSQELRTMIDNFKKTVRSRTVAPSDLQGATITLSNFGMIAGRYATPIIVPPMVAILGCGRLREEPRVHNGKIEVRRVIPMSLTFDHRAITGGEATRFLGTMIKQLEGK
jgi:2-oxoisovalerate dehydrogenase E2 component (dihydrolipoyl transacylase)